MSDSRREPLPRGAYVRPMRAWWRRDPYFVRYMWREATAFAVWIYALVLAVGLLRLAQGEVAWNGWLQALRSPASLLLHLLLLVAMVVHARSWFQIMPKTMPPVHVGGRRLAATTVTRLGWTAAVVASLGVWAMVSWWVR
jgi:fumarate reductase subunit C